MDDYVLTRQIAAGILAGISFKVCDDVRDNHMYSEGSAQYQWLDGLMLVTNVAYFMMDPFVTFYYMVGGIPLCYALGALEHTIWHLLVVLTYYTGVATYPDIHQLVLSDWKVYTLAAMCIVAFHGTESVVFSEERSNRKKYFRAFSTAGLWALAYAVHVGALDAYLDARKMIPYFIYSSAYLGTSAVSQAWLQKRLD
jgi:hypothetical protein